MSITRRLFAICLGLGLLSLIVVGLEISTTTASTVKQPTVLFASSNPAWKSASRESVVRRSGQRLIQPAPAEKTIGEARKNIHVLKDFPDSQLIPMMNLMAASLGVRCTFCHVNNAGQWDFASDDKPEKKTAREMITMTLSVNKTTFDGRTEVSCFTCHAGRTNPVSVLVLPLPEPAPRPGRGAAGAPGAGAGQAATSQPTADDVLNKYVAAIGGQAAIDKLKTRVMKGTYTTGGNSMNLEIDQSAPDKVHVTLVSPQGQMERGYNGSAGWEKTPHGVNDLAAPQLAEVKSGFTLFRDFKLKEQFTRMSLRKEKLDGKDVNVITGAAQGGKRERLYFDAETGLLLRRISYTQTPIGVIPEQFDYEDYRDVDGVKIPFTLKTGGVDNFSNGTRKFTEIKINAPVDDASFNKPAAPSTAPPKP